eukprot:SAG22_NODE_627_length_8410_cov_9.212249_8_plen_289_part_00
MRAVGASECAPLHGGGPPTSALPAVPAYRPDRAAGRQPFASPGPPLGWMEATDRCRGFRQTRHFGGSIALLVPKLTKFELGREYGAPAGWHWATRREVELILGIREEPAEGGGGGGAGSDGAGNAGRACEPATTWYAGQHGWDGPVWRAERRCAFLFRDSHRIGGCLAAEEPEGLLYTKLRPEDLHERYDCIWLLLQMNAIGLQNTRHSTLIVSYLVHARAGITIGQRTAGWRRVRWRPPRRTGPASTSGGICHSAVLLARSVCGTHQLDRSGGVMNTMSRSRPRLPL